MNKKITKVQELIYELKVKQAMTKDVIKVQPKKRMSELREILRVNRISGIPVTDGDKLVGIVSIEDFIKCLADGKKDIEAHAVSLSAAGPSRLRLTLISISFLHMTRHGFPPPRPTGFAVFWRSRRCFSST